MCQDDSLNGHGASAFRFANIARSSSDVRELEANNVTSLSAPFRSPSRTDKRLHSVLIFADHSVFRQLQSPVHCCLSGVACADLDVDGIHAIPRYVQ